MTPASPGEAAEGDVRIVIARDPALVRTVRLVAAAVARRAECSDSAVEEIRLAVGEACALMVGAPDGQAPAPAAVDESDERVSVTLTSQRGVSVVVSGRVEDSASGLQEVDLDAFSLLRGLSESLEVVEDAGLTRLHMTWAR